MTDVRDMLLRFLTNLREAYHFQRGENIEEGIPQIVVQNIFCSSLMRIRIRKKSINITVKLPTERFNFC